MPALARWVFRHKRLVAGVWFAVTIAAFAALGPAGKSLSQQFNVPGREGFDANQQIAAIYGGGGDVASLVPVGCAQPAGRVGWSYADPHAVLLDDEETLRTHRRGGSIERRPQSARVTLENTPAATPSGVQVAVRKGSL